MKKKITLFASAMILGSIAMAQPTLVYETHRLKAGNDNVMSYCEYMEPGISGENVVWDFSGLKFVKAFTGYVAVPSSDAQQDFKTSNTELTEFNSRFYFDIREDRIEQYGYSSADGRVQTHYTTPFIKMKYPFTYGDIYSGSFSGTTYYSGVETGSVSGTYTVEADAWGKLILPGGVSYSNTLRVKTEKSYVNASVNHPQEVTITTYRWYNSAYRYPLLVLTDFSVKSAGNISFKNQAAYNNNAVGISPILEESVALYPNPTSSDLMLEYDAVAAGTLTLRIFDKSGKELRKLDRTISYAGLQQINLTSAIRDLKAASYLLVIQNGEQTISRNFSVIR